MRKSSEETKKNIVSAAWILLKEGLDTFTMRKLAEKANLTVSTIYHYFPNKEFIFAELIEEALEEIIYPVNSHTWQEKFEVYGQNILSTLEKFPSLAQLLLEIPPILPNYVKLNDNLLMIANSIPIKKEERLYFVNMYLNFILTFKVDAERLTYQSEIMKENDAATNNNVPFLVNYRNEGYFDLLGSKEMFTFGLKLLINGLEKKLSEI